MMKNSSIYLLKATYLLVCFSLLGFQASAQYLDKATIEKSNIIWIGETHGTPVSYQLMIDIMEQMEGTNNPINYILLEGGIIQERNLNAYLEEGKEEWLESIMMNYKPSSSFSKEFESFLRYVRKVNLSRSEEKQIRVLSIDIEHAALTVHPIIAKYTDEERVKDTKRVVSGVFNLKLENWKESFDFYSKFYADIKSNKAFYKNLWAGNYRYLSYLVRNCKFGAYAHLNDTPKKWDAIRDSLIYENFKWRKKEVDFEKNKFIARWGQAHTLQAKTKDGVEWIAARIKQLNPEVEQTTFYPNYLKCSFLVSKYDIPGILRWMFKKEGNYHRKVKALINSNGPFQHISGAKYLKKIATEDIQIFPMGNLPEDKSFVVDRAKTIPNTNYAQYIVLIQNAEASTSYKLTN